ncbi:MAG TPA: MerR family transcriptional regulator [Fimbriiglobus sp.]|jgi:hypothetical protein
MQVGRLADRLDVPYRDIRYLLEQGILPKGIAEKPGRGEHRDFTPAQAFWIGLVLKLKQCGIRAPAAKEIANFAKRSVFKAAKESEWDSGFNPFAGELVTDKKWYLDIGDMLFTRFATNANPDVEGIFENFWCIVTDGRKEKAPGASPVVIIRIDLTQLASLLIE